LSSPQEVNEFILQRREGPHCIGLAEFERLHGSRVILDEDDRVDDTDGVRVEQFPEFGDDLAVEVDSPAGNLTMRTSIGPITVVSVTSPSRDEGPV
jgi:hypothetical protein